MSEYMTLQAINKKWGIPVVTLVSWIKRGILPKHQIAPFARIYIDPKDIPIHLRKRKK
jgi:hypothetical protein